MKKLLTILMVLFTAISVNAACDWSGIWMKRVNQQQNVYTFKTNLDKTVCIDYHWIVYDYQLKRVDTVSDFGGITQVQFNKKGKYRMSLKAVDECNKCDTTFNFEVDITIFGKVDATWSVSLNSCKSYSFKLTNFNNNCYEYYYTIYKSKFFDTMSKSKWDNITDSAIYVTYDFNDTDLVYYSMVSELNLNQNFKDSGRHLLIGYWYNGCTGIDTFVMRKLTVCSSTPTSGIKQIRKEEPKLIGIYDMLGRPVYHIRENEILIYIYSDGRRVKQMVR